MSWTSKKWIERQSYGLHSFHSWHHDKMCVCVLTLIKHLLPQVNDTPWYTEWTTITFTNQLLDYRLWYDCGMIVVIDLQTSTIPTNRCAQAPRLAVDGVTHIKAFAVLLRGAARYLPRAQYELSELAAKARFTMIYLVKQILLNKESTDKSTDKSTEFTRFT